MTESKLRQVAGGLIFQENELLLVKNDRHYSRSTDWTTPGGVIDAGETILDGLTREVKEETGLVVSNWQGPIYEVYVDFLDRGWTLGVQTFIATNWMGTVMLQDPDGIVTDAAFCSLQEQANLLGSSPVWVREPLLEWQKVWHEKPHSNPVNFRYEVFGFQMSDFKVRRRK